ncbi:MAG TPA: hypothetical protein DEQ32_02385 [Gammaproteobacteria bacterium]|nr:hypothetical protein [Gammaproteobacteria bacterium]
MLGEREMCKFNLWKFVLLTVYTIYLVDSGVSNLVIAAEPPILSGIVTSQEEGRMEGVVISVKRAGSPMTISVVTNANGEYRFPTNRLGSGSYEVAIRAVGYDLASSDSVELKEESTSFDLQLRKTSKLSSQLSNGEWMISAPGTFTEKQYFDDCTMCHTLERPINSSYGPEEMSRVVQRMGAHTLNSTPAFPHFKSFVTQMLSEPLTEEEIDKGRYFSSVNLSSADTWEFPLQTFPRPSGKATKVVITTYDLPRPNSAPHDALVGPDGNIWYNDFVSPYIGKLDPETGEVTEYELPIQKPGFAVGSHAIDFSDDGLIYASGMHQSYVVEFNPTTEEMKTLQFPHWQVDNAGNDSRITVLDPSAKSVNGLIWVNGYKGGEMGVAYQVNPETNEWTPVTHPASAPPHNAYDVIADSQNNMYGINMDKEHVWWTDAKTLETKFYRIPTAGAGGRRGNVDLKDRLWWAQYRGNGIGMFDPETETITEWPLPTPWTSPYDAEFDEERYVWTGGMNNDLAVRLNVETGEFTEYLLPFETNIRHVDVQITDNPYNLSSFWVVGQINGKITRVEPTAP